MPLTVFGYVDALKRLPSLLSTYRDVKRRWLAEPPAVFVGIDAPDFNLRLEHQLRQAGTPTVHFVGPSIWAWRYERIHKIRESVSHMLVLFPFEEEIYRKEGIPVTYVGHPLAGAVPMQPDRAARARLGIDQNARVLAILPGSRSSEIRLLAPRFLQAAQILQKRDPALLCIVPMVNEQRRAEFQSFLEQYPVPGLRCVTAQDLHGEGGERQAPVAWSVMEASTAVLVASGTATLETALYKRPMVISYVLSPWMRRIMAWKSGQERPYLPWVGLPNVLLRDFAVPELLQDDATPEKLAEATWTALTDEALGARIEARFTALHQDLLRDTPARWPRAPSSRSPTVQPDLSGHAPARADHRRRGRGRPGPAGRRGLRRRRDFDPARPIEGLADSKALAGAARSAGAGDPRARAGLVHRQRQRPGDRQPEHPARHHAGDAARGAGPSVAPQLALVDGNQAPAGCTVQTVIKETPWCRRSRPRPSWPRPPATLTCCACTSSIRNMPSISTRVTARRCTCGAARAWPCAEHRRSFAPIKAFGADA